MSVEENQRLLDAMVKKLTVLERNYEWMEFLLYRGRIFGAKRNEEARKITVYVWDDVDLCWMKMVRSMFDTAEQVKAYKFKYKVISDWEHLPENGIIKH